MSPYGFVQNICWVEGVSACLASCFSEMSLGAIPWLPPGPSSAFPGQLGRKLWRVGVGATVVSLVLSLGMGHPRGRARLQMAS